MLAIGGGGAAGWFDTCAPWLGAGGAVCEQPASRNPASRTVSELVTRIIPIELRFILSSKSFVNFVAQSAFAVLNWNESSFPEVGMYSCTLGLHLEQDPVVLEDD